MSPRSLVVPFVLLLAGVASADTTPVDPPKKRVRTRVIEGPARDCRDFGCPTRTAKCTEVARDQYVCVEPPPFIAYPEPAIEEVPREVPEEAPAEKVAPAVEAPPVEPAQRFSALAGVGGSASVGGGAPAAAQPLVYLAVSTPLYKPEDLTKRVTYLEVDAALTALPGEASGGFSDLPGFDAENFKAIEFAGRICQPLAQALYFVPCLEAGFTTRLANELQPRHRAARWLAMVVKVGSADGDYLSVGFGADERLDESPEGQGPFYRPAALVSGALRISNSTSKTGFFLVGRAILHLRVGAELYADSPPDRVVVGVMVTRDSR